MKIRPLGAETFHADRQIDRRTDIMKLIAASRNSANAPKKPTVNHVITKFVALLCFLGLVTVITKNLSLSKI